MAAVLAGSKRPWPALAGSFFFLEYQQAEYSARNGARKNAEEQFEMKPLQMQRSSYKWSVMKQLNATEQLKFLTQ